MNASEEPRESTRVEREVLEILERSESAQTPASQIQSAVRRQSASAREQLSRSTFERPTLAVLSSDIARIAGALILAICAAALSDASRLLAVVLAIASALIFFSLWLPARPSGPGDSPRWRGQDLRDNGPPRFGGDSSGRGPRLPKR